MKKIKISETQLKNVLNKVISEQLKNQPSYTPPNWNNTPKTNFGCVGVNDFNQKGQSGRAIVYDLRDGQYQLSIDGTARKWALGETKQLRRGSWQCSPNNDSIEVTWEDDPKAKQYLGLPKNVLGKSIGRTVDISKCAKEMTDIYSGKFLLKGCKGPVVTDLQNRLNKQGYKLNPDGVFGDATKQAIMQFQKSKGIQVDGVFGRSTFDYLVGNEMGKSPKVSTKPDLNPQTKMKIDNYSKDR